jgi:pimeloyl-ACP methyl ester carboxylesterase
MSMRALPTFLLVHGSWHGPWCWDLLRPALKRLGAASETVSLPSCGDTPEGLGTFFDDAATVSEAAAAIPGEVVVVGHSYGGAVVCEASFGRNVSSLVFLAAFMPDTGRSYVSYLPPGPLPPYVGLRDDGTFAVPEGQSRDAFYADCSTDIASWANDRLRLQPQAVLGAPVTEASWRRLPSTYVVTTEDHALPPDFQRMFAAQAGDVREFASSHSPFLSRPDDLAELLVDVARGRKGQEKRAG